MVGPWLHAGALTSVLAASLLSPRVSTQLTPVSHLKLCSGFELVPPTPQWENLKSFGIHQEEREASAKYWPRPDSGDTDRLIGH